MYLTWGIRSNLSSIKFTWGFNGLTSQKSGIHTTGVHPVCFSSI